MRMRGLMLCVARNCGRDRPTTVGHCAITGRFGRLLQRGGLAASRHDAPATGSDVHRTSPMRLEQLWGLPTFRVGL